MNKLYIKENLLSQINLNCSYKREQWDWSNEEGRPYIRYGEKDILWLPKRTWEEKEKGIFQVPSEISREWILRLNQVIVDDEGNHQSTIWGIKISSLQEAVKKYGIEVEFYLQMIGEYDYYDDGEAEEAVYDYGKICISIIYKGARSLSRGIFHYSGNKRDFIPRNINSFSDDEDEYVIINNPHFNLIPILEEFGIKS